VIAEIGAVKLGLEGDFPILGTYKAYVRPIGRFGNQYALDPFFTTLTGITEENIKTEGVTLQDALAGLDAVPAARRDRAVVVDAERCHDGMRRLVAPGKADTIRGGQIIYQRP